MFCALSASTGHLNPYVNYQEVSLMAVINSRKVIVSMVVAVILLSGFIILKPTKASSQPLDSLDVRYIPPDNSVEGPIFLLSSYDHSEDLSETDFSSISFIQLDDGQLISASGWRLLQSGHHFQGKLYFQPLTTANAKQVKLIIKPNKNEDGIVFEWP